MSVFSDDDLKRLKEESSAEDYGGHQQVTIDCADLDALLARLEAAEAHISRCVEAHYEECEALNGEDCNCGHDATLEVWRKAAGK